MLSILESSSLNSGLWLGGEAWLSDFFGKAVLELRPLFFASGAKEPAFFFK